MGPSRLLNPALPDGAALRCGSIGKRGFYIMGIFVIIAVLGAAWLIFTA